MDLWKLNFFFAIEDIDPRIGIITVQATSWQTAKPKVKTRVELVDCKFAGCERQGLRCTESAAATATHCVFAENGHEGLVAAGSSVVECRDCVLRDNGGPGADVSGCLLYTSPSPRD